MRGLVIALLVLGVVFGVIEHRWPAIAGQRRLRRGWLTDLGYWILTPLVPRTIGRAAVILAVVLVAAARGVPLDRAALQAHVVAGAAWVRALPGWAEVLLVIVLGDLFGYWIHRLFHVRPLWKVHAVHHSSRELDWLAAARVHPLNEVLGRILQVLPLYLLGFRPGVLAAYVPLLTLHGILLHANVRWTFGPLRYVISSPTFHRWHHTAESEGLDRNFGGLLPLWDLVFGTFYMPKNADGTLRQPERFGVPGDPVPDGLWGQLAYPFRR